MVENVKISQDSYIKNYMAKLPDMEKGKIHIIKKGDNLWNIARSQLGKKPKRGEVNDYMLAIAKLNGLDTMQKMNNLKVDTTIYLPKDISNNTSADRIQTKSLSQDKPVTLKKSQPKTLAEKYFDEKMKLFLNDKSVVVEKALYMPDLYNELYHVSYTYTDKKGYVHRDKPIMSVSIAKDTKKIDNITFEGDQNIYNYGYDYKIGQDNIIRSNDILKNEKYGKITKEQRAILEKTLFQHINKK